MKIKFISLLSIFLLVGTIAFADNVPIDIARQVAKNFFYEKTDIKQEQIVFEEEFTINNENADLYYIFNVQDNDGFIIISAEDAIKPVFGYSLNQTFETENQPENVMSWMQQFQEQILYVKENNIQATLIVINTWQKYNTSNSNFVKDTDKEIIVYPLTEEITWDQGRGWNALCPEDPAGPGGRVYAGCVATAMGIVMKYWEYPIQGIGEHGYYPSGYDYQFANYGETTYFWSYMEDDSPNYYSALLLHHLGISVEMMYSAGGSGAYSQDVPYAMETYYGYDPSISFESREGYTDPQWIELLHEQLDASKPMYYSGCSNSGCHAFVCDGYDTDDYFHFNFGWSGSNNGFYLLDNVGGFSAWNGAVINMVPPASHNPKTPVGTLIAELDYEQNNKVVIEWDAVEEKNKSLTGYKLYRCEEIIEENLPISTTSYTETDVSDGDYYYGIRAIYSDGMSLCASDFVEVKSEFKITFQVRKNINTILNPAPTIEFNGETKTTNIVGEATFENVSLGTNQNFTINHPEFNSINDFIHVNSDDKIFSYFDAYTNIQNEQRNELSIYPNPNNTGVFYIENYNENKNVIVSDLTGRIVFNSKITNNQIDLSNCSKGVYIIKIENNTELLIIE